MCVHDQNVSKAGNVAALCPNVRSLDVSQNLFSNWREIIQLSSQLPDLRELDVRYVKTEKEFIQSYKNTCNNLKIMYTTVYI